MKRSFWGAALMSLALTGCVSSTGNVGNMPKYGVPVAEAEWIREGEPLEYDGQKWYPRDDIDVLTDAEVVLAGEYRGVQFFTSRVDVRPYSRLYTKFGRNKFRIFLRQKSDD